MAQTLPRWRGATDRPTNPRPVNRPQPRRTQNDTEEERPQLTDSSSLRQRVSPQTQPQQPSRPAAQTSQRGQADAPLVSLALSAGAGAAATAATSDPRQRGNSENPGVANRWAALDPALNNQGTQTAATAQNLAENGSQTISYGNARSFRELTDEEWAALSPTQQRAVQGNYQLYLAKDDPEKQAALLATLGMNPEMKIDGYASYNDILALTDNSAARAEQSPWARAIPTVNSPATNLDSLTALANSVYHSNPENPAQPKYTSPTQTAIDAPGLGAFSRDITPEEAAWIDENILANIGNDDWMKSMAFDQTNLDSLYSSIATNIPKVSRNNLASYLSGMMTERGLPNYVGNDGLDDHTARLMGLKFLEGSLNG